MLFTSSVNVVKEDLPSKAKKKKKGPGSNDGQSERDGASLWDVDCLVIISFGFLPAVRSLSILFTDGQTVVSLSL